MAQAYSRRSSKFRKTLWSSPRKTAAAAYRSNQRWGVTSADILTMSRSRKRAAAKLRSTRRIHKKTTGYSLAGNAFSAGKVAGARGRMTAMRQSLAQGLRHQRRTAKQQEASRKNLDTARRKRKRGVKTSRISSWMP